MRRRISPRALVPAGSLALLLALGLVARAKEEAWRQEGAAAFAKAQRDGVVVTDAGLVRLGRPISRVGTGLEAARVWALARARDGALYAATGDEGKVFVRRGDAAWSLALDADDSQVLCLAALPDGRVVAGTGPGGRVVDVSDPGHPASQPGPDVQYVWALAATPDGTLYAATGPEGRLYRRAPGVADWAVAFDAPQRHLLSLAVAPDGSLYTGTDRDGLIYRVPPQGPAAVVYDASQGEIQTLAIGPDGALYAGTASAADEGASGRNAAVPATASVRRVSRVRRQEPAAKPGADAPGGTARPRAGPPGENAVYRIGPEGVAREVFRAKTLIYALAWQGDALLVGTGPEGRLFEVRGQGREQTTLARVDYGQVLALRGEPDGGVLLGVGDPGGVLRLEPTFLASGTLTSEVLDTKLASRFGNLTVRADRPAGTGVAVQVRTGQVAEPDTTWTDWSPALAAPDGGRPGVATGRFAQYRVRLETTDPKASPTFQGLALYYRTLNLPPEIAKLTVPDVTAADGTPRKPKLDLKWDATDPNDDPLTYTLSVRKEGWPDWLPLGGPAAPALTEKTYAWDTTTLPAGVYQVRVTASDRAANRPDEARTASLTSEPFVVDHQPPTVTITPAADGRGATVILADALTRLVSAEAAVDGGEWTPAFPQDGLFDTAAETLTLALPDLKPGVHVLVVRTVDAAGNPGSADAILTVR